MPPTVPQSGGHLTYEDAQMVFQLFGRVMTGHWFDRKTFQFRVQRGFFNFPMWYKSS